VYLLAGASGIEPSFAVSFCVGGQLVRATEFEPLDYDFLITELSMIVSGS
jgi:hypothetical protein